MLKYFGPLHLAEEIQEGQVCDSIYSGKQSVDSVDGYQCLEAFGDDLSLEDSLLLDTDDLLMTA